MFSQAWREIDEEKQSEVVRQALASLQSDERFLVIEALCTANGTAFPQVSRRTTSQLIPDIVAALPRMADSAVQRLRGTGRDRDLRDAKGQRTDRKRVAGDWPCRPYDAIEIRRSDPAVSPRRYPQPNRLDDPPQQLLRLAARFD